MGRVEVRVTPGARDEAVLGWQDGVLRVRVRARAEAGQANDAVCRLLAQTLGVPPRAVSIRRGATSRQKSVNVDGLNEADLRKRFAEQA